MTTISHSPSPAASPHAAFHTPSQRHHYSPRAESRPFPAGASPRRPFNAPPPASPQQARREQRIADSGAQPAVDRRVRVGQYVNYVDRGTQYSPEAFPPTAAQHPVKVAPALVDGAGGSPRVADLETERVRKRKERSVEPQQQQMSETIPAGTTSTSNVVSAAPTVPPSEPEARTNPSATAQAATTQDGEQGTATNLPQRSTAPPQDEPQEARSTLSATAGSSAKRARADDAGPVKLMPRPYETCSPRDLGVLMSNMLMELIRLNDQIPLRDGRLTRFHSRAPPGISVADYLQRLIQHATLSPPILLSMVYYIDRLCAMYPAFTINSLTVHRFLITAATVAAKGLSDSFWTNPTYARIGGIPVSELATLELELLQRVHWRIVPKPEVLVGYYEGLIDRTDGWELERSESERSSSIDESVQDEDQSMADEPA